MEADTYRALARAVIWIYLLRRFSCVPVRERPPVDGVATLLHDFGVDRAEKVVPKIVIVIVVAIAQHPSQLSALLPRTKFRPLCLCSAQERSSTKVSSPPLASVSRRGSGIGDTSGPNRRKIITASRSCTMLLSLSLSEKLKLKRRRNGCDDEDDDFYAIISHLSSRKVQVEMNVEADAGNGSAEIEAPNSPCLPHSSCCSANGVSLWT